MFLLKLRNTRGAQADKPQPRWIMAAEKFLAPDPEPPIDEDEIREAVWELLFKRSHPALVRVVGKQVYHRWAFGSFFFCASASKVIRLLLRTLLRCYGQLAQISLPKNSLATINGGA